MRSLLGFPRSGGRTGFEAEAVMSGLQDVAAVSEPVEPSGCHFRITEDRGPFAENQVGGVDDAGTSIELAQQVEEQ